jgi:hypothetical protein
MLTERLPETFRKGQWHFSQVARAGDVALYRCSRLYDGPAGAVHYEVVRLHVHGERTLPSGAVRAAGEEYPPSSSWGTRGWTYDRLADALAHYAALVEVSHV